MQLPLPTVKPSEMRHTTQGRRGCARKQEMVHPLLRLHDQNSPTLFSEQCHPLQIFFIFSLLHVRCCFVNTVWQVKILGKSADYEETEYSHQPHQKCPHHGLPMWLECTGKGPISWKYSYLVINGQTSNGYVSTLWIWHKYLEHCIVLGTHKFPFVYS